MPPKKAPGKPGRPAKTQPVTVKEVHVPQSSPATQAVTDTMLAFGEKFQSVSNDILADLQELHGDFTVLYGMVMGTNGTQPSTKPAAQPIPEPEPDLPTLNFEDMSVGDLQDVLDEYGLDVDLASIKGLASKQAAVEDAYLAGTHPKGSAPEEAAEPLPDFTEMTKKELQECIDNHDLDVSLADYRRLAEMQEAVEEAYLVAVGAGSGSGDDDDDPDGWPEN